ncbi:response regulator transcription factor [Rhizobium sp. PL01]|uniref:response regulator transcription factor n=1 Tax=Rhizobium sp. PL01 TaxID=3085631 RepID=UPI002981EB81|nr:response regulator transcription factor [Rhizobium sp. PL01]MDW5317155.1 response regulator transcription factor [Rhizobium sp. PL01]
MTTNNAHRLNGNDPVRLILVEDDFDLRQGLTDFLRLNAFAVTAVANGREFDQAFATEMFDVAIVDVNLPDTNGFDLTRLISGKTNIGIIMLTARTMREDRLKGYAEGANLYLTKPVDGDELVFAIRNLAGRIKQAGGTSSARSESGPNWYYDGTAQRLVSPQGTAIILSGREAKLLVKLAEEKGRVVSRAVLSRAMGYPETSLETRSIDAVLRRLRSKARDAGIALPIHVTHALGFHFAGAIDLSPSTGRL